MNKYPECEKLEKVSEESQKIGAFLDWLQNETKYIIAEYSDDEEGEALLFPIHKAIEQILAEYFKIDLNKVEKERKQILEDIRKQKIKK